MNRMYRVLDTETIQSPTNGNLVWQIGWVDVKDGIIVDAREYIVGDVYYRCDKSDRFYKDYDNEIANGDAIVMRFSQIKDIFNETLKSKHIYAYNALFDEDALNNTTLVLSNNIAKKFIENDKVTYRCIMHGAAQTFLKTKTYQEWAKKNNHMCKNGIPRLTAECAYRYITKNNKFVESHTALDDSRIEAAILDKVMRYHKKINWTPVKIFAIHREYAK